jgi:hypothetical protein
MLAGDEARPTVMFAAANGLHLPAVDIGDGKLLVSPSSNPQREGGAGGELAEPRSVCLGAGPGMPVPFP